jgi:predicted P-loop ATPase
MNKFEEFPAANVAKTSAAAILHKLPSKLLGNGRLQIFRADALQLRAYAAHIDREQTAKDLNIIATTYGLFRDPADTAAVKEIIDAVTAPIVIEEKKAKPRQRRSLRRGKREAKAVLKGKTRDKKKARAILKAAADEADVEKPVVEAPAIAANGVVPPLARNEIPDGANEEREKIKFDVKDYIDVASRKAKATNKTPGWRKNLIGSKDGTPKGNVANAITALRLAPEWQGVLAYDEFALVTRVTHSPPWEGAGPVQRDWAALDDVLATNWLQHNGISVGLNVTEMAVEAVAQDAGYHPVKDYLNGLTWDGKARVGSWLTSYFGVERSPYADAVGERFLISAVARVMQPGCKADAMLIIEGPQGIGKSRAIHALAGKWFSDELAEIGTKDASLQLRGAWIFELSELDAMHRSEIGKIKAFLSRKTDRFRPPYGARVIEAPRQCVLVGTTNGDAYLKDETGARRQWPVRATKISPEAIERDRDQLWAEAVHLYRTGRRWWIDDPAIASAATEEQDDRYSVDPWDEVIARYVDVRTEVSVSEILRDVLGIPINDWSQFNQNRVARSLKSRKWFRCQKQIGERRQWLYRRY